MYGYDTNTIIFSIIITGTIGLLPPLFVRFAIVRRSLAKWVAIAFSITFWIINLFIFTALGSQSKTHTALLLVAFVSYWILRHGSSNSDSYISKGYREKEASDLADSTLIPLKKYSKKYGVKQSKIIGLLESEELRGKYLNGEWFVYDK